MFRVVLRYLMIAAIMVISSKLNAAVLVQKVQGDVQVRRGLEEEWRQASNQQLLEDVDTILTLEGEAVLSLQDGSIFKLGPHSIMDIGDLRKISRQEMFLMVMSQKVQNMAPRNKGSQLELANLSSVHGGQKRTEPDQKNEQTILTWKREFNAAKAMYQQQLLPNAVVKLHRIIARYQHIDDCGLVSFYLGKSFENMDEPGQAVDFYQAALDQSQLCDDSQTITQDAATAVRRLSD
ncbi:MAG: hypothetical protein EHM72_14980 [Calditrichaeota bacterium]|nr:MAG: hypothetical protein EHM72_21100 [Calditrichota bacterium]RPH95453.1 MAG: hypothetical protein EHM72_14980 [Calditrichota bacterium]